MKFQMKAYNTSLFNTKGILKIFNNWIYRQKNVFNATKMTKNFTMRPVIFQKKDSEYNQYEKKFPECVWS